MSKRGQRSKRRATPERRDWLFSKRPVFRFVLLFAAVMVVYYAFSATPLFAKQLGPGHLRLSAAVSSSVLGVLGEETQRIDMMVASPRFSVNIRRGCDAIEPSVLLVAAILAFPVPFRGKWPGILVGVLAVQLLNLIRIVSLYYTGVFYPKAFDMMHIEIWQPVFILMVLLFWLIWVFWTLRRLSVEADVPA